MIPAIVKEAVTVATQRDDVKITRRVPQVHQSNELFDVWLDDLHLIAKQYLREDEWKVSPAREHASQKLLLPLDVAPHPYFYDAVVGPVVIYEYMDGRMWGRQHPSSAELERLAERLAQLNRLTTRELWLAHGGDQSVQQRMQRFQRSLDSYALWAEEAFPAGQPVVALAQAMMNEVGELLTELDATMPALVFCRTDPRFANVIVRPDGRFAFVDWEDAGLRDPALDIADLLLHPEQEDLLSWAEWQPFLVRYLEDTGMNPEHFVRRVTQYGKVFPLFWMLTLMQHGVRVAQAEKLAGWQINGLPATLRLQRYLARATAASPWDFDADAYGDVLFFPTD